MWIMHFTVALAIAFAFGLGALALESQQHGKRARNYRHRF